MQKRLEPHEKQMAEINETIDKLDEMRTEFLDKSMRYNLALLDQLNNEANRMARKHGTKSNRIKNIESGIADLKNMLTAVDMQLAIIKGNDNLFNEDTWKIEGNVTLGSKFLEGASVYLALQEGKRGKWEDTTSSVGYYSITLEKEEVEQLKDQKHFLFVSNESKVIYKGTKHLIPEVGLIDKVDISIAKEDRKRGF